MQMEGRRWALGRVYSYGFNGKENDNEVKGEGNQQGYGMRIYDPRVGKFLSVDPITPKYPELTPYQFASNTPIANIDLDGLEKSSAGKIYSDAPSSDPKYSGGTILRNTTSEEPLTRAAYSFLRTMVYTVGAMTEIPGQMHYGDKIRQEDQINTFPLTHGQNFKTMGQGVVVAPFQAVGSVIKDPGNPDKWGEAAATLYMYKGALKFMKSPSAIRVDLMGGEASRYGKGWINYDLNAKSGIKAGVEDFSKYFGKNSVDEMVVNNPQASFLNEVAEAIKSGGTLTIRGQMGNKYFKNIWKMTDVEGFKVLSRQEYLSKDGYNKTDGTPLGGDQNSMNEIILEKK